MCLGWAMASSRGWMVKVFGLIPVPALLAKTSTDWDLTIALTNAHISCRPISGDGRRSRSVHHIAPIGSVENPNARTMCSHSGARQLRAHLGSSDAWASIPLGPSHRARAQARFGKIKDAKVFAFAPPAVLEFGNATGFDFELQDRGSKGHAGAGATSGATTGTTTSTAPTGTTTPTSVVASTPSRVATTGAQHISPRGWESPGLTETMQTADLLAELGIEYVADWVLDDQPIPIRTKAGALISVPYTVELNDVAITAVQQQPANEILRRGRDQFGRLYQEGATIPRIMAISIHPYLNGVPHRIKYLEALYDYILRHEGVLHWTDAEILDWYKSQPA